MFTYSVLRVLPDPLRGEFVNVGVVMVDDNQTYSKMDYSYRIQTRLESVGGRKLVQPILRELGDLAVGYDVAGEQVRPELRTKPPVSKELLEQWVRDRGGTLRMSPPRLIVARDPDTAFGKVFQRYVRRRQESDQPAKLTPEAERSHLRDRFARALSRLRNFDSARVVTSAAVPGVSAHHWLDLAVVGRDTPTAFAHALPLKGSDERPVYVHRGLILDAANDWPANAPMIALHDDPPNNRRELFEETTRLIVEAGGRMVSRADMVTAAAGFEDAFWSAESTH
jgi:Protein of unknown function (DUF3037)